MRAMYIRRKQQYPSQAGLGLLSNVQARKHHSDARAREHAQNETGLHPEPRMNSVRHWKRERKVGKQPIPDGLIEEEGRSKGGARKMDPSHITRSNSMSLLAKCSIRTQTRDLFHLPVDRMSCTHNCQCQSYNVGFLQSVSSIRLPSLKPTFNFTQVWCQLQGSVFCTSDMPQESSH